jgi:hypothetical protein
MVEITNKVDMMFVSDLDAHLMGRRFKLALLLPHTDFKQVDMSFSCRTVS